MNKQTRAKLMTDVLVCLKSGYRIELVGSVRNCPVVADQWPHKAAYYSVGDNGGEIHVHELNSSDPGRSVAYETIDGNMNAGTMAMAHAERSRHGFCAAACAATKKKRPPNP